MGEKRGRKRKNNLYFGPEEEAAVVRFLECDDEIERNRIYNKWLKTPLDKMVESIIRKYKLYRKGETFENLHSDTLSFLITKAHMFKPEKGRKAYSYYGTICKHYIIGLLQKDDKKLKQFYSYEDVAPKIEEKDEYTYHIDDDDFKIGVLIQKLIDSVQDELDGVTQSKKKITDNERKVGLGLIAILNDWELTLDSMNGGNKFNKNTFYASMRNYTNLTTKDIRLAMKRYKVIYEMTKLDGLENGLD